MLEIIICNVCSRFFEQKTRFSIQFQIHREEFQTVSFLNLYAILSLRGERVTMDEHNIYRYAYKACREKQIKSIYIHRYIGINQPTISTQQSPPILCGLLVHRSGSLQGTSIHQSVKSSVYGLFNAKTDKHAWIQLQQSKILRTACLALPLLIYLKYLV